MCDESEQMTPESENAMGRDDGAASQRSGIQQDCEGLLGRLPAEFLARVHMAINQEIERRHEFTGDAGQPAGCALGRAVCRRLNLRQIIYRQSDFE